MRVALDASGAAVFRDSGFTDDWRDGLKDDVRPTPKAFTSPPVSQTPAITEGRVGIRHMLQHAVLLGDITIARTDTRGIQPTP